MELAHVEAVPSSSRRRTAARRGLAPAPSCPRRWGRGRGTSRPAGSGRRGRPGRGGPRAGTASTASSWPTMRGVHLLLEPSSRSRSSCGELGDRDAGAPRDTISAMSSAVTAARAARGRPEASSSSARRSVDARLQHARPLVVLGRDGLVALAPQFRGWSSRGDRLGLVGDAQPYPGARRSIRSIALSGRNRSLM